MSTLFKRIKDWATSITTFRTGDVIPVDGPSGTAKMSKDSLLKEAANNTLGSIHNLATTATDADLVAGNYFVLGGEVPKKVPGDLLANSGDRFNLSIFGKGNSYISAPPIHSVSIGRYYRLHIINTDFSRSTISTSDPTNYLIGVGAKTKTGSAVSTLVRVNVVDDVKPFYDFKIPANTENIVIGCRADAGERVAFVVEDVTQYYEFGLESSFVGKGNGSTADYIERKVTAGRKYRIYINNNEYNRSEIPQPSSSSNSLFYVAAKGTGVSIKYLVDVYVTKSHPEHYYEFVMPSGYEYIQIGGRANVGERVYINLVDITTENNEGTGLLLNAKNNSLQGVIVTDTHGDSTALSAIDSVLANTPYLDCVFFLGDASATNYHPAASVNLWNIFGTSRPVYSIIGNHDVARARYVGNGASTHQLYEDFIKPMVDNGWLTSGEYQQDICYWYHDDSERKIRFIGIYDYDAPVEYESGSFDAVAYDPSYPLIKENTEYASGTYLNAGNYTGHSFVTNTKVTTGTFENYNASAETLPVFKYDRYYRVIGETQANWFLDKLATTPDGYRVVILTHTAFSKLVTNDTTKKFGNNENWAAADFSDTWISLAQDFISEAVDAFVNGTSYSETITHSGTRNSSLPSYSVAKDFSVKNSNVKFMCFLGGHYHLDMLWKHPDYNQYGISPISAKIQKTAGVSDLEVDVKNPISLTTASFDTEENAVNLTKIGVNITKFLKPRDYERLELD